MSWLDRLLGKRAQPPQPSTVIGSRTPVEAPRQPAFHERQYEVFVFLSGPTAPPPWVKSTWTQIAAALQPLVEASRGPPTVRTTQLRMGSGSPNQRGIAFGRIGWAASGIDKWTHIDDGRLVSREPAEFLSAEAWAPSWSVCQRELRAPDVYLGFSSQPAPADQAPRFTAACVLAVACELSATASGVSRQVGGEIASILGSVLSARWVRPWGFPRGPLGYSDAINDLAIVGLFKPGPRHDAAPRP